MSHTFVAKSGNRYFHNGDFSGDILFPISKDSIPIEDMIEFVGEYVKYQRSEFLEAYRALNIDLE